MLKKKSGTSNPVSSFADSLIDWYEKHKRDLPFRGTRNPYLIWVSEIILQQTRMDQGISYYHRFVERFPDIFSLAEAEEEDVLRLWQGLGYYSRARNMHAAAREIVQFRGGVFPNHYPGILALKGVGEYSAASVASLAFDEPRPAIDGNVFRFLSRLHGYREPHASPGAKKWALSRATALMDPTRPGLFNQAMIEFGALVCIPQNPGCAECLMNTSCEALRLELVARIPARVKPVAQRIRYFNYLLVVFPVKGTPHFLVQKRTGNDIWRNLYELPLVEEERETSLPDLMASHRFNELFPGTRPAFLRKASLIRHQLSHQVILTTFYHFTLPGQPETSCRFIPADAIHTLPFPRVISRFLVSLSPDDWM